MDMTSRNIDVDSQTPQPSNNITPTTLKSSPFTNGTHKRHLSTTTPSPMVVSYKECLKNHAASLGGHALDGCGEFMPSSTVNPNDPRSLKCAACGCHRNFHRREPQEQHIITTTITNTTATATATTDTPTNATATANPTFLNCIYTPPSTTVPPPQPPPPLQLPHRGPISQSTSPTSSPSSPPPLSHLPPYHHHSSAPHMLLALGNAYSTPPHSDQAQFFFISDQAREQQQQQYTKFIYKLNPIHFHLF